MKTREQALEEDRRRMEQQAADRRRFGCVTLGQLLAARRCEGVNPCHRAGRIYELEVDTSLLVGED